MLDITLNAKSDKWVKTRDKIYLIEVKETKRTDDILYLDISYLRLALF